MSRGRLATILAVVLVAVVAGQLWYGNRHHFFDLGIYRDAMIWWQDHPLYDYARPDATQGKLEFTYPPFAALLLYPLGWLSWGFAVAAYAIVSATLFGLIVWWLVRPLAARHGLPGWFVFGVAFALFTGLEPIREAFTFGQINFVLWALILLDLLILLPRGSRFTGVGIGIATAIKLVPGIFVVYLLITRRWLAAGVAAITTLAATGLAAALAPGASTVYFTEKLLHPEGVGQLGYVFNQSLMGLLARLAAPGDPSQLAWVLLCLPVAGFGLWRAARAANAGDEVVGLTLTGLVGSLISPVTWAHHIVWFIPAIVVLVDVGWPGAPRPGRTRARVLALVTYATVTYSILSLWAFSLGEPGGFVGFVLTNWLIWLMLILLALLPIRRHTPDPIRL